MEIQDVAYTVAQNIVQTATIAAAPCAIYYLGGPQAIWQNGGYIVRPICVAIAIPTLFNSIGAIEGYIRTLAKSGKAALIIFSHDKEAVNKCLKDVKIEWNTATAYTLSTLLPTQSIIAMALSIGQFIEFKRKKPNLHDNERVILNEYIGYYSAYWTGKQVLVLTEKTLNAVGPTVAKVACKTLDATITTCDFTWKALNITGVIPAISFCSGLAFSFIRAGMGTIGQLLR